MATENVKVIKVDTNAAQTSVKDLRNELKELRSTMLSTEQGTEEYNKALLRSAEIQHTLKEQMEEINASAMDFGQISSNLVKATGGLVAGFQAATAAMNLFGIENEDVLKAMQKMQSLMAITQALPSIDSGIKAFRRLGIAIKGAAAGMNGLKAALISTGIGAAVVAVGALAANWDKVTTAVKKFVGASDDTINNIAAQNQKIKEQTDRINELRGEIAKANDEYDEFVRKEKYDKLNADAKKRYDDLTADIQRTQIVLDGIIAAKNEAEAENNIAKFKKQQELESGFKVTIQNLEKEQNAILNNADSYKELAKSTGNATDAEEEEVETIEQLIARTTDWLFLQTKEGETHDAVAEAIRKRKQELKELRELESEDEDTSFEDNFRKRVENTVESLRQAFKTSEEQYQQEVNDLKVALNTKLITEEEYYKLSTKLREEYNNNQKALAVAETQVWMSSLKNISQVFDTIGNMIDTSTDDGKEKYRDIMYTSTIISMLAGIGGAVASAFMPVNAGMTIWGQIAMAATTSASVLATGIAQLTQIKNASENSTLGGGSALSTPNTGIVNNIIAPVQYTRDVDNASIEGAIKNQKVYVTETDITNTQNKVKVTENEARF